MSELIEALLQRTMGLDASTIGPASIQRAVAVRMQACRLSSREQYWERLNDPSGRELQELIEATVVPETWFFRDREAFAALVRIALETRGRAAPDHKLHLLSLPCSTGEEPYSIAMALLDAGLPAESFAIDAIDISERSLARARRCLYGKNSFRGADLDFRDRHFVHDATGWHLNAAVRRQVRFHHKNLLDAEGLPGSVPYDIIFCRNLLIYFDRPTQDRAIATLAKRLAPTGAMFVGPSETALLVDHGFVPVRIPQSFAFRPPSARPPKPAPVATPPPARKTPPVAKPRWPASLPPLPVVPVAAPPLAKAKVPANTAAAELASIRELADRGKLVDAAKLCAQHLQAHGPSAEAFYLLGLVHDADGRPAEAADFYRKAIYLDPVHHEALVQLALLRERLGDHAAAQALNERARKVALKMTK